MDATKQNAFLAICKACNLELKPIDHKDLKAQAAVIKKHASKALLLGFSDTQMKVQIGRMNGVLVDRVEAM